MDASAAARAQRAGQCARLRALLGGAVLAQGQQQTARRRALLRGAHRRGLAVGEHAQPTAVAAPTDGAPTDGAKRPTSGAAAVEGQTEIDGVSFDARVARANEAVDDGDGGRRSAHSDAPPSLAGGWAAGLEAEAEAEKEPAALAGRDVAGAELAAALSVAGPVALTAGGGLQSASAFGAELGGDEGPVVAALVGGAEAGDERWLAGEDEGGGSSALAQAEAYDDGL